MNAYDVLETRSRDNEFCRSILNFMVNHPLEKYTKVRLLNIEDALQELKEIAKQLTDLTKLLKLQNDEFENVLTIFMMHISSIFARNMVEILICLSFNIEPHITFWENQCKLNNKENQYKLYSNLNKIYSLSISWRRARIFKKLLSDLYLQIGHIQCWFWALIKLKNETQNSNDNIIEFISEMNELFNNNNNNNNNDKNVMHLMIETISFADSFVIKMQKDIKIWGKPSHWRRNYKIYASFCCVSIMFTSIFSYYNTDIITNNSVQIFDKLPTKINEIFSKLKMNSNIIRNEYTVSYEMEKKILNEMVTSFEEKYKRSITEQYQTDIKSPIRSATKGSLFTNIFIQIQQIKVEISKLMINVNDMMHSNGINMQILVSIPFIGSFCLFYQIWCNKNDKNKIKRESTKELRFLFRSIYSVLLKNYNEQYVEYEQCGLMLSLMYKCCVWAQNKMKNKLLSIDEYQWLRFDINHFVSKEFSVKQKLSLLKRMEIYYL